MKINERLEYDAAHGSLTVRGTSPSQEPYEIVIDGDLHAKLWLRVLNYTKYQRRCVGSYSKRIDDK